MRYADRVSRQARLVVVLCLNLGLVAGLVVAAVAGHSLGVMAEGADYLADAAAIGVSLLAITLSGRHPRATTIAAGVNGAWLLILSALVAAGSVWRLAGGGSHAPVHGLVVVVASAVAAAVMVTGALVLGDPEGDLNMRAVLLDTAADAFAAAGVAAAGAVIALHDGLSWLDPAVALIIAVIVGYHAVSLLGDVWAAVRPEQAVSRATTSER